MDKKAGVDLFKKLGDPVQQGEPMYRIYAQFPADFKFAKKLAEQNNGYNIDDNEGPVFKPMVDL
jgi:thymidine phosphorylase